MRQFDVAKQVEFAMASALTETAKRAQKESLKDIRQTFTVRNNWDSPSNAMGIKVLPASKGDLESAVVTRADWLTLHEEGGAKIPKGQHIAVPTSNVRRTKRDIIQRSQRPRNLKRSFIIKTRKRGIDMIFQRRGRGKTSEIFAMYKLVPRAKIKENSTITEQTMKIVEKNFDDILFLKLVQAFRTAR